MKITREWLFENQTEAGSWTQDQLECVGVEWPPREGWIARILGSEISAERARRFEQRLTRKQLRQQRRAERLLGQVPERPTEAIAAAADYLQQLLDEQRQAARAHQRGLNP